MNNQQAFLGRLQKLKVNVKTKKRGIHKGNRRSSKFGSSLEFSDFRAYQPGDDVRQIDWNVYGRTQKHYIKRFLDEQDLSIAIYLDVSSSMREIPSKWEFAKKLAASLSYVVLASEDRLFFSPVGSKSLRIIRRKGAVNSRTTFLEIGRLEEPEKLDDFVNLLYNTVSKTQQLTIIISDGLEPLDKFEALLKKLSSLKQECWFFQVLSREEISPSYTGDVRLIDIEKGSGIDVSMHPALLDEYEKRLNAHNKKLEAICRRYGGAYILTADDEQMQYLFFNVLPRLGLLS